MFKPYLHIEKFGNTEVEGIELGVVYVFPKLDGTNASVWFDGRLRAGSRTRELDTVNPGNQDNAGFAKWLYSDDVCAPRIHYFFRKYPYLRLYGEWLVPHTFKGYREDAWNQLYVFDVYNDETDTFLSYETYQPLLDEFSVEYIPPLAMIRNGSYENFLKLLEKNLFLIPDGEGVGEGIVIKNYDYQNKYGRISFAKIIRNEFRENHIKTMGAPLVLAGRMNEESIVKQAVTSHLVDKTYEKIKLDKGGWSSRNIPELLNRVFYDVVREELWDAWKEIGFESINGKALKALTINKIKELRPDLFA